MVRPKSRFPVVSYSVPPGDCILLRGSIIFHPCGIPGLVDADGWELLSDPVARGCRRQAPAALVTAAAGTSVRWNGGGGIKSLSRRELDGGGG